MEVASITGFIMAKKTVSRRFFAFRDPMGEDETWDGAISLQRVSEDLCVEACGCWQVEPFVHF